MTEAVSETVSEAAADPWLLLAAWLPGNAEPDRPQVTLSTVSPSDRADARTVLLTEWDELGFYFHTDSRSRKATDIARNSAVALTFLWPSFTRQLTVQGDASIAPRAELDAAYAARSPYLQQLAWQNSAEFAVLPHETRRAEWGSFELPHGPPASWTGYLVRPLRMTFWSSDPEAASRREEFTLEGGIWHRGYLPG